MGRPRLSSCRANTTYRSSRTAPRKQSLDRQLYPARTGFTNVPISKSFSLSVTTTHSLASATAAMIVSSALRGRPRALASAINRAQISAAGSSKARIRPAKRACGPSDPSNYASSWLRRRPAGFSDTPRRISAIVSDAMNRSSSICSDIHLSNDADGIGFAILLIMLVSSRHRIRF